MARRVVLTCDKCTGDQDVQPYSIGAAQMTPYEVDLCTRCAEPVRELMDLGRERLAAHGTGHVTSATKEPELRSKIYSIEELDQMEKEYREKNK